MQVSALTLGFRYELTAPQSWRVVWGFEAPAGIQCLYDWQDFRSENGLYSLIQAQFDSAARHARPIAPSTSSESDGDVADQSGDERPRKRRRLSSQSATLPDKASERVIEVKDEIEVRVDTTIAVQLSPASSSGSDSLPKEADEIIVCQDTPDTSDTTIYCTPQPKRLIPTEQLTTSPLSSPPTEVLANPPSAFSKPAHSRLVEVPLQLSSSPLSSPPLFFSILLVKNPQPAAPVVGAARPSQKWTSQRFPKPPCRAEQCRRT